MLLSATSDVSGERPTYWLGWCHMSIRSAHFTGHSAACSYRTLDDVIKWKHFPRYWPFVRGIHRSPVNSLHKGQWHGALMFSFICVWMNGWVNNRKAGDLRRYRAHYDVTVMQAANNEIIKVPRYWSFFAGNPPIPNTKCKKSDAGKSDVFHVIFSSESHSTKHCQLKLDNLSRYHDKTCNVHRPLLQTWINFNTSMDK